MSVEFDSPANRIIQQLQPKNQFRIDTSLPDLAFLRQLSVQGRLRYFFGSGIGAGTPITITPTIGETLFIYKILLGANAAVIFTITNAGNTRAQVIASTGFELNLFDSLVGDGIKTVTVANASGNVEVSVLGWIENTSRIRDVTT